MFDKNNIVILCKSKTMTNSYFYNARLDEQLRMFANIPGGRIEKRILLNNAPDDFDTALSFLAEEGYLEESEHDFKITYKGKALINQGGFIGKHRRERILFYSTIVAAIAGTLGLAVSIVALLH